ncbi:putative zinc-type alcohol dehydrogenase-like protein YjmD [Polaromonas vacuolata]|uniref:Putative zinc-type alcohol dehydrogenase-like protein YjmD n=2 Tax=Polaromonas vacuolata TaxID=37448 RepID=A0A6H2H4N2_9BURK|nr:putative zinc-type alcohol dehydrogenase-like protein YjmD [Polaromonas vacuolata]
MTAKPNQNSMKPIPKYMTGMQLTCYGGLDMLVLKDDIAVPTPGPRDVLIKVGAAGVNNTDINTRIGWYAKSADDSSTASWSGNAFKFPRIQGADVCGVVVAVGAQADPKLLHQRVLVEPCLWEVDGKTLDQPWYFGSECDGGFAQYCVVAGRHAHVVNSPLSDVELASFPCSYSTAENMLTRANVVAGDVLLVTGASGGVGSATIQLAKARGAHVIALTAAAKLDAVLALGADQSVERSADLAQALGKNSVDVVIDLVAGPAWPSLLDVLKPFGRYAAAGAIGGHMVALDMRTIYLKDLSLFGCTVLGKNVFANLVQRIASSAIKPLVAETFALADLHLAQTQFETKAHIGKLVIDIGKL